MHLITPHWQKPDGVLSWCTTRERGVSDGNFGKGNIALHVGDQEQDVLANRAELPYAKGIYWLQQVHGDKVLTLRENMPQGLAADASITDVPGLTCAVMTADCVPVLLAERSGKVVAAVHAGWRGLVQNIIGMTLDAMNCPAEHVCAWIGPAISAAHYQVGEDVQLALKDYSKHIHPDPKLGHYRVDLPGIAATQLREAGCGQVAESGLCTFSEPETFYSYRRSAVTGRIACGICIQPQ